jgi:hypothetical protein
MMMKNYLSQADIKPYSFAASENQRIATERYAEAIEKLKNIDDKDSWQGIIEANKITNEYEQKIGEVQQWSQLNKEHRQMVNKNMDEWSNETIKGVNQYSGGEPKYKLKRKIPDFGRLIQQDSDELYSGNEVTISKVQEITGKTIEQSFNFDTQYWNADGTRKENAQKRFFRNYIVSDRNRKAAALKDLQQKGKLQPDGSYYVPQTKKTYSVKNIEDFAYDMYKETMFPVIMEKTLERQDTGEDGGRGGSDDKKIFQYQKDAQPVTLHPFGGEADLYEVPDEHYDYGRRIIKNITYKPKGKGKWSESKTEYFDDAELTGILMKDGKLHAKFGIKTDQKPVKKKGKQVYRSARNPNMTGTIKELAKEEDKSVGDIRAGINSAIPMYVPVKEGGEVGIGYAPVEDNPTVKEFIDIQGIPDAVQNQDDILNQYSEQQITNFMNNNNIGSREEAIDVLKRLKREGKL